MAVEKLSQIAAAGSPPALADQFVGVAGGATDNLWSLQQFCRLRLTADTNYYITTAGNDSNDGSIGSPWLTLQHANDFLASNVDFNGHTVIVNIGAGTFAGVSLTAMEGGGTLKFLGATWQPTTTTITGGPDGDCVHVDVPLGSTTYKIAQVTLTPAGTPFYCVAVYKDCHLDIGGGGAGIVLGTINNGSSIGIYGEGLCSLSDAGNQTTIDVGPTQFLSVMFLTAGAVYRKYGNWLTTNPVAAGNGFITADTNGSFVNLDGDFIFLNGAPTVPGGIPFHLRAGGVLSAENSYFGDVTYAIVENATFLTGLGDPLMIPTDPSSKNIQTPSNGFSIAFPESTYTLILKPAGTLATGTITLPGSNYNGKIVVIKSTQQVTALTILAPLSGGTAIASGVYNSGTGQVTLTLAVPLFSFYSNPNQSITIAGVTGTGSVASVNTTVTADAGTTATGLTVKYTIASGLTLTITPATGTAAGTPDVFGSPGTIPLGGQLEAQFDLTTYAWYIS